MLEKQNETTRDDDELAKVLQNNREIRENAQTNAHRSRSVNVSNLIFGVLVATRQECRLPTTRTKIYKNEALYND